jgi:hypothetical protein
MIPKTEPAIRRIKPGSLKKKGSKSDLRFIIIDKKFREVASSR